MNLGRQFWIVHTLAAALMFGDILFLGSRSGLGVAGILLMFGNLAWSVRRELAAAVRRMAAP